jgi:F-type H+-transporting ATPase subunit b
MLLIVLIVFQILIFIFLVFLLRRVLTRNITSATQHLDALTQDYMKKQEEIQRRLDEIDHIYEEKINEAEREAERIKKEAEKEAEEKKSTIIKEARIKQEEIIKQAEKARQNLILEIEKKIKEQATDLARELLDKVLPEEIRKKIHFYLLEDFIKNALYNLENIESQEMISEIKITTPFSLSQEEIESIHQNLKEKLGRDFEISQVIEKSLIAGIMITIGSLVLDASLKWRIKEKAKEFKEE